MSVINLFPTLDATIIQEVFDFTPVLWKYQRNQEDCELVVDNNGVVRDVDPQYSYWNPESYGINYSFIVKVKDAVSLFGDGKNAVACRDAIIGVATSWFSRSSYHRGSIEHGEISNTSSSLEIKVKGEIPKAFLRDSITFEVILYLKNAGNSKEDESHLANQPGSVLGVLWTQTLLVDGIGSVFPTSYVHLGTESPLWTLTCNWEDPMSDSLNDTVCLNINKDNKLFKYLYNERNNKDFDYSLLMEVMSSSICIIVEKLRAEGYNVDDLDSYDISAGSVVMMLKYFNNVHNCDFSNPIKSSESIHKMIEKTLKR